MSTTEDAPTENKFPFNISHETDEIKKAYFDNVFGTFIDKFLLQKNANCGNDKEDDYVQNYTQFSSLSSFYK